MGENENSNAAAAEQPSVGPNTLLACQIARGEAEGPQEPVGQMIASKKDLNARGKVREWWFRMRWDGNQWAYLSEERLRGGTFLASDRHQTVYGDVYAGDVLITHDRGGPVDTEAKLVIGAGEEGAAACPVTRRRDGQLSIRLPDGTDILRPNPRSK
jgi:hypothetical protein